MFSRVLIANRGEIACRIMQACRKLDIETVAIYSDADRSALFVEDADITVPLGGGDASSTYLNVDKIIAAAKKCKVDAIHPGYGFLSENASFAEAVEDAGLVFIGPKSQVIQLMGSKIAAKTKAAQVGVPIVPGYQSDDQSDKSLHDAAKGIGFPILIKASAGGGGRGMRLVQKIEDFAGELSLARQEAEVSFGDPAILLERYVEAARHIEVQILGDQHGNILHLFERDCSLQRNNQKVVEEAPAPNLPMAIRTEMLSAAVQLAEAVQYQNAGTVEFIYDPNRQEFYFLEMNTRLQVEHPVTELVTGIDIVEWQIRIAAGQEISFQQTDVSLNGWAIEARLAAENPAEDYMPQTGLIKRYRAPAGQGIRIDTGIQEGSEVTHHYDSMLAKLIVHAETRETAIRKLDKALHKFEIEGFESNLKFLSDLIQLPAFSNGTHTTHQIETEYPEGWIVKELDPSILGLAVLCFHQHRLQSAPICPWTDLGSWRLTDEIGAGGISFYYLMGQDGVASGFQIENLKAQYSVRQGADEIVAGKILKAGPGTLTLEMRDHRHTLTYEVVGETVHLQFQDRSYGFQFCSMETHLLAGTKNAAKDSNQIMAPMPGLIVEVLVQSGDLVQAGQTVIVLEAMKLMQKLTAPISGVVDTIPIQPGDTPQKGKLLLSIEPVDG